MTSPNYKTHKKHLKILFTRLAEYRILISPEKCQFGTMELNFLGRHVLSEGISPLTTAVDAIVNFVKPEKQRALRRYLGMVDYYHRFIPHCAAKLMQLSTLLTEANETHTRLSPKSNFDLSWNESENSAFIEPKQMQSFFSKKLSPAETRYSAFDRELLAVYATIRHFRHNLEGRNFFVNADHKPLTYVVTSQPISDM